MFYPFTSHCKILDLKWAVEFYCSWRVPTIHAILRQFTTFLRFFTTAKLMISQKNIDNAADALKALDALQDQSGHDLATMSA